MKPRTIVVQVEVSGTGAVSERLLAVRVSISKDRAPPPEKLPVAPGRTPVGEVFSSPAVSKVTSGPPLLRTPGRVLEITTTARTTRLVYLAAVECPPFPK
jgi:hypothetical protein